MRLFGLIGYPLGHSFSKKYFTEKFERENIDSCTYELFPIENIEQLPALLQQYPQLEGLNITIPYKQDVLPYLTENKLPAGLQACNCIRIQQGRLIGYNTDVVGFESSLLKKLKPHHRQALVLGNGGAAAAVMHVLDKLGIAYKVVSRQLHGQSQLTYHQLTAAVIQEHSLIINTTPLGTFPNVDACPAIPYEAVTDQHYLFDLVYNPAETLFMQKGIQQGAAVENGYDMLVGQAEEAWRIWNEE